MKNIGKILTKKRAALTALFYMSIVFLTGCYPEPQYSTITGYTMGTTYRITLQVELKLIEEIQNKIDTRLNEINQLMSTYISDSELSIFNGSQSTSCHKLSAENFYVIQNAIDVSHQTKGKFDVTIAPLIAEWGFDQKETNDLVPSVQNIKALLAKTGYQWLSIEEDCVSKGIVGLSVNLSAIAKGYGVDQLAQLIESYNINNYLVEIGGETASKGINAKLLPWRLAIEAPSEIERRIQTVFLPKDHGVATSGDYRNYFEKDGVRFSHTIDPTTGYPINHDLVSVTVLHQQTMMADAYATAFMVMGKEATLEFSAKHNLAVYLIVKTKNGFEASYSKDFSGHLVDPK